MFMFFFFPKTFLSFLTKNQDVVLLMIINQKGEGREEDDKGSNLNS